MSSTFYYRFTKPTLVGLGNNFESMTFGMGMPFCKPK